MTNTNGKPLKNGKKDERISRLIVESVAVASGMSVGYATEALGEKVIHSQSNENVNKTEDNLHRHEYDNSHETQKHHIHHPDVVKEPEINVISTDTIKDDEGNDIHRAILMVDNHIEVMLDVDLDGKADYVVSDVNGDGQITNDEIVNTHDIHQVVLMPEGEYPLPEDFSDTKPDTDDDLISQLNGNDMPDYTNTTNDNLVDNNGDDYNNNGNIDQFIV
jgi:hypothetical protein